jgi:hypothetical protein
MRNNKVLPVSANIYIKYWIPHDSKAYFHLQTSAVDEVKEVQYFLLLPQNVPMYA